MKPLKVGLTLCLWVLLHTSTLAQRLDTVSLNLGFSFQFQFAGYIAAYEKGYYEDVGLEIAFYNGIGAPFIDIDTLKSFDYFIGTGSQLLGLDRRNELVLVAPIFQHSPLTLVARKDLGVNYLSDLAGRKIGTGAENMAMLISAGVDIDSVDNIGPTSQKYMLETGELHAVSRYLLDSPLDDDKYISFKPLEYGVDFYGECLVTHREELQLHPERIENMYAATLKGWQYAIDHPAEIIDIIRTKYNPNLTLEALQREADMVINSLVLPNLFPIGYNTKSKWVNMEEISRQFGIIEGTTNWDTFLYSEVRSRRQVVSEDLLQTLRIAVVAIMIIAVVLTVYSVMLRRAVSKRTVQLTAANSDIQNKNERLAEQAQELEELNSFKNKMLAVISHDVKGPLSNMEGLIHLVKTSDLTENEFMTLIDELHGKVKEVSGFLLNILMWAKSQLYGFSSAPEYIDPKKMLDKTVAVFQPEIDKKNLRVVNTLSPEVTVFADPSLAELIFRNLLANAIKFSYENTHIVVNGIPEGIYLKVTITDEGIGISDDRQEKLLKGAVQSLKANSSEMSTGLGLMLCKEFVDLHQGKMGVDSKEGKGTSVWFTLPLTSA